MPFHTALIIGLIVALVATILAFVFLIPDRVRDRLPGFLQFCHDLINFRTMIIENVSKLLYVFCTFGCIAVGIFLLFGSNFLIGLLVLIAGPLVCRVLYELIMLFVLLVQNTITINRKLK